MISLSTWKHGFKPNRVAFEVLARHGESLDAVEQGAKYCEADLTCMSVGRGGIPDTEGVVSLDASIMSHDGLCGAVAFVQHYEHVISIARRVMEKSQYIMLAGSGAELFAEREGFLKTELLTEKARALYEEWKKQPDKLKVRLRRATEGDHEYIFESIASNGETSSIDRNTIGTNESHDTIGILALDSMGKLAGACTTSGLAFKLHGRVGDSPIIGAGLYVQGSVGAAVATGTGELVIRACSAFHVVELMRQGEDPERACELALQRIRADRYLEADMQVGLIALREDGAWSGRSLRPGFQMAAQTEKQPNNLYDVDTSSIKLSSKT